MKSLIVTSLILLLKINCISQSFGDTTDSLMIAIQSSSITEDEKLSIHILLIDKLKLTNPDKALDLIKSAFVISINQNDSIHIAKLFQLQGSVYNNSGMHDSAVFLYYKAAEIYERQKDIKNAASVYNDIGRFYRKDDYERAIYYYDKAIKIYTELKDEEGKAVILNESGVAFENAGNLEEAIRRYNASLAIQKNRNDSVGIGYSLEFLSGAYLKKKEYAKSEQFLLEALAVRKKLKDTFALSINYTNMGEWYTETGNTEKALSYFILSNELAKSIKYTPLIVHNYYQIAQAEKKLNNYKSAFDHITMHNNIKDSIYNVEKAKQIEELSLKYETNKNKLLITEQRLAINKRNYLIAGICILFISGALLGYSAYRRYKYKQHAKLQLVILEQQEQATRSIIKAEEEERQRIARDLHDGVGQMVSVAKMNLSTFKNNIGFQNKQQQLDLENIIGLIDDSCREVRNVSHNMMPNALLKNSLASAVRDFIDKVDKDALKIFLYTEGLDNRIDINIETVFYRVIQECVNNVIKHAHANKLDISIILDNNGISATIEDNGIGFSIENKDNFEGLGLKNILTRISYLKGHVDFDSHPGKGTLIAIHVPFKNNEMDMK